MLANTSVSGPLPTKDKLEAEPPGGVGLGAPPCSGLCECANWCCEDISLIYNGNGHHPRCKHYEPPKPDPRHAVFGKLMWEMIQKTL